MQIFDICAVLAHATDATSHAVLCDGLIPWCVGKCTKLNASVHMQQAENSAGAPTDKHFRHSAAATQVTQHLAVSPTQPTAATSPLEAATAVPLPDSANKVVLTARKRGRPSKADLALRRQIEEQQSAAATAADAAAPNTIPAARGISGAQLVADKDGGRSSKNSNPGANATGSRASGSKGKKQAPAAAADADDQADAAALTAETQPAPSNAQARHVHGNAPCVCCMSTQAFVLFCLARQGARAAMHVVARPKGPVCSQLHKRNWCLIWLLACKAAQTWYVLYHRQRWTAKGLPLHPESSPVCLPPLPRALAPRAQAPRSSIQQR